MIGLQRVVCIPVSALRGDNVVTRSDRLAGYRGPTLMGYLETVEIDQGRMPCLTARRAPASPAAPSADPNHLAGNKHINHGP